MDQVLVEVMFMEVDLINWGREKRKERKRFRFMTVHTRTRVIFKLISEKQILSFLLFSRLNIIFFDLILILVLGEIVINTYCLMIFFWRTEKKDC